MDNDDSNDGLDPVDIARQKRKPRKIKESWSVEKRNNYLIFKLIIFTVIAIIYYFIY